jgi:serine/threonine-protein kinase RsbW
LGRPQGSHIPLPAKFRAIPDHHKLAVPPKSTFWSLMSQKISLNINSDLRNLAAVLAWFEPFRLCLDDDATWQQCRIAIVEGFTNAVRHAHRHLPRETPILLEAQIEGSMLVLKVWDQGQPFDLEQYLQQLPPSSRDAEGGRGLRLIREISDCLDYQRVGDSGNCLRIAKQLVQQPLQPSQAVLR